MLATSTRQRWVPCRSEVDSLCHSVGDILTHEPQLSAPPCCSLSIIASLLGTSTIGMILNFCFGKVNALVFLI